MNTNQAVKLPKRYYRPDRQLCPLCQSWLVRRHIRWRKKIVFLQGPEWVTSYVYGCSNEQCENAEVDYYAEQAEALHLKHRQSSRELLITVGYHRFWGYQTIYEIHDWLTQEVAITITARQVLNLIADFLALLKAGQAAKIAQQVAATSQLVLSVDGMQPEKGNRCLYVVREEQKGIVLLAVHVDESCHQTISAKVLQPVKALADQNRYTLQGIVSDAQESIRLAVAQTFPGLPHQTCQFHALRAAGTLTFAADRKLKKQLKATLRRFLARLARSLDKLDDQDACKPLLQDYVDCFQTTLLEDGIAPFALGGLRIFDALTDLASSLQRCQKKESIRSWCV